MRLQKPLLLRTGVVAVEELTGWICGQWANSVRLPEVEISCFASRWSVPPAECFIAGHSGVVCQYRRHRRAAKRDCSHGFSSLGPVSACYQASRDAESCLYVSQKTCPLSHSRNSGFSVYRLYNSV